MITVSHLEKSFKTHQVLKDVSLVVKKGSIFALLGSNGAGKTTIIRILSTLMMPDGGSASINGYDVAEQGDEVRDLISLTGQFVAIDEVLTGRENLKLIGELRRIENISKKVDEWLSIFNLEEAANRKVSTYSGGMKRRLDIAMSLMDNPKVLFLDEPTTGLDPQNRMAMWDMVKQLSANGTTIFLTTQYLEEAEYLSDTIAILHDGKIIVEGSPNYLKEIIPRQGVTLNFDNNSHAQEALDVLSDNGIHVDSIEQNLPSLEDVFLTLIKEKKEENNYE